MVRERTDIEHIVLVASHTHSGSANPGTQELERKIAEAIVEADRH